MTLKQQHKVKSIWPARFQSSEKKSEKMKLQNSNTPILVLGCRIGALAIMRSLGVLDVSIYAVDSDPRLFAFSSRYLKKGFIKEFDERNPEEYLDYLVEIGNKLGKRAILIPTTDELSVFVAEYSKQLSNLYIFTQNDSSLVKKLMSKKGMYNLALKHNIPTPTTLFPHNLDEVKEFLEGINFPVMLKGIRGNRLEERTGIKMMVVHSKKELLDNYRRLEDPESPNLMIQELIPGADDQVYIFNGYFNRKSECLAAFTGYKVRQFPVHVGAASLGECTWNEEVSDLTISFMKKIGYQGILDIGYRLDPRDGLYKVLDINPRVGQAFRLFVAENGIDVVRALYLDLTGQEIMKPISPKEGRRWVIEDYDIISSLHYYQEGTLRFANWLSSYKRLEEAAWFNWKDPVPFLKMVEGFLKRTLRWLSKKIGIEKAMDLLFKII